MQGRRQPEADGGAEIHKIDVENRIPSQLSERALAAFGLEDGAVRAGLEAALRRARDKAKVATPSRAPVAEVTFEAARVRVVTLEAALAALADFSGPEVDVLTPNWYVPKLHHPSHQSMSI